MKDVKRYRRRDIVAGIVDAHRDLFPPELLDQMARELKTWPAGELADQFTNATLREVVPNSCGLWYGLASDPGDV